MHFVFCHQKPERSFFFKGRQFPLCARCTGIALGFSFWPVFTFSLFTMSIWWAIGLIVPTLLDGTIQYYLPWESNNPLRVTSGTLAGIGTGALAAIIGKFIGNHILLFLT